MSKTGKQLEHVLTKNWSNRVTFLVFLSSIQSRFFSQQGHCPRGFRPALSSGNAVCIGSTTQGGGGSFKHRKPLETYRRGELLWCMDGRANPPQLPKVFQACCVLYGLTSKWALRHSPLCFLNAGTVARMFWSPCPRRFSEPTFRPSGATKHWKKHRVFQLFSFPRTLILFPLTLSSLPLPPTVAASVRKSEVWLHFLRSACAPAVIDYRNLHDLPILCTMPPRKAGKIRKSSGFLMRYNEKTGQYIPEALWHLVTEADPSCLERNMMAHAWIVDPCSLFCLINQCFLLQIFWTHMLGHT